MKKTTFTSFDTNFTKKENFIVFKKKQFLLENKWTCWKYELTDPVAASSADLQLVSCNTRATTPNIRVPSSGDSVTLQ